MVYVVVAVGFAVTVVPVVAERPADGLQEKLLAPEAVSVVLPPAQIALVPVTSTTGVPFTATVTVAESIHPAALVPVTLYVVVAEGVDTGLAHVAQLSVAEGLQE